MGASNVLAAFRLYAGKVPPTSLNLLVYMAAVAKDADSEPSWWEGHDMLAVRVLGYPEPVGRAGKAAVERGVTPLFRAGAITTTRHASGHFGRVTTVRYRLWTTGPAPHENRGERSGQHPTVFVGSKGQLPTVSVSAPHGNRGTEEKEENLKQERDNTNTALELTNVEGARPAPGQDRDFSVNGNRAEETERQRQHRALAEWERQQAGDDGRAACPQCGQRAKVMPNGILKNHGPLDPHTGVSACHRVRAPAGAAP